MIEFSVNIHPIDGHLRPSPKENDNQDQVSQEEQEHEASLEDQEDHEEENANQNSNEEENDDQDGHEVEASDMKLVSAVVYAGFILQ